MIVFGHRNAVGRQHLLGFEFGEDGSAFGARLGDDALSPAFAIGRPCGGVLRQGGVSYSAFKL